MTGAGDTETGRAGLLRAAGPAPSTAGRFHAIGTTVEVLTTDPGALAEATELVRTHVNALDRAASRFHDSELQWLEANGGKPVQVSWLLFVVLDEAIRVARDTGGLVTPTVGEALVRCGYDRDFAEMAPEGPPLRLRLRRVPDWQRIELDRAARCVTVPQGVRIDVGASAKAGCADRAAMAAAAVAECGVLVNLGGDIAVAGPPPPGGWSVGLADRADSPPESTSVTVAIVDGGLATSGTAARRWHRGGKVVHHLIDPETGAPVTTPWRTVTVSGSSCLQANAAATAAMILGHQAPAWLEARGLHARLVPEPLGPATADRGTDVDSGCIRTGSWPTGATGPAARALAS